MNTSYKQIAVNLRGTVRDDWCDQIEVADELLEALKIALEVIEGEYPSDDWVAKPVMDKARAAIAKATGTEGA